MIREGIKSVKMVIGSDLKGLVKFRTVSLRIDVQRRYPGTLFSSDDRLR